MSQDARFGDVSLAFREHIAKVEMHRPPHNYFDLELIRDLADAFAAADADPACRALVLAAEGKSFCAGAKFAPAFGDEDHEILSGKVKLLYEHAVRLFSSTKPVVAAIQGAAVGGGLGLAMVADFRVVAPEARFAANFVKLGIHPGFGLTYTLPRVIGHQRASLMLYTGRRITGEEAVAWQLGDVLAPLERLRQEAEKLAAEIAEAAPLGVQSTRATMRRGVPDAVRAQAALELSEQSWLSRTVDHREGIVAVAERRLGRFHGE